MYGLNSIDIVVILFLLILLANEIGSRVARHSAAKADPGLSTQTNAIQAGILGLLALLLGFSFNMALQRFDARSAAVIEEANAIGTAWADSGGSEQHVGTAAADRPGVAQVIAL